MDQITVGEIVKAQGIAGEVKVKPLTDSAERFKKLRVLYIDDKPFKILGLRVEREHVFVKLQGVDDRNAAESLRGKFLCIDRVHAVDLDEGEYFIADLLGCRLLSDTGEILGEIIDIAQNTGTADVITARGGNGKELRFPFLNRLVAGVDVTKKTFTVYKHLLDEVCVYDD